MKPIDISHANFEELKGYFDATRKDVHAIWLQVGECTTRRAAICGLRDILTFRPRTTELYQLGLLELVGREGREGVYRARTLDEWETHVRQAKTPVGAQQQLL